jgi:hypothetical protein
MISSGIKYFIDLLGVDYNQVYAAFNFLSGQNINFSNIVYPENWATGSSSGILNKPGTFFQNTGTGFFDGSMAMKLSRPFSFDDESTILFSYEKLRPGNEILMSSITGNSFNNYSGFCIGVNDANKLYFKYWNPVEGPFTHVYSKIIADKNLFIIHREADRVSIGRLNNNFLNFDLEEFTIKNNAFRESNQLFLGGMLNSVDWANSYAKNFSGYFDNFYIFKNLPFIYNNFYISGLIYNLEYEGIPSDEAICTTTGYLFESGFSLSGITGYKLEPYILEQTGVTGKIIENIDYSYTGVTGYENTLLGFFKDPCENIQEISGEIPLSGLITIPIQRIIEKTGIITITGYNQTPLTGLITGIETIYITGETCENLIVLTGDPFFNTNFEFLKSLSFSEISLFNEINFSNDIVEVYYEDFSLSKTNFYNKNLEFNNKSTFNLEFVNIDNIEENPLFFLNGQLIINSGFNVVQDQYDTYFVPKIDYYNTGRFLYTRPDRNEDDNIFYDYFSGNSEIIGITGLTSGTSLIGKNFNNSFVFVNGQKLISGINYTGENTINININSGENFIFLKSIPKFNYITGNKGSLKLPSKSLIENFSNVYYNGIKQKLINNYLENSIFDLISGDFKEEYNDFSIYLDDQNFFQLDPQKYTLRQELNQTPPFGFATRLSKNSKVLLVSQITNSEVANNNGAIWIYTGDYNSGWIFKQKILGTANSLLGTSSALNYDGSVILAGALGQSANRGHVFIYTGTSEIGWSLNLEVSGSAPSQLFGRFLDCDYSGNVLTISREASSLAGRFTNGGADIYTGRSNIGWTLRQTITGDVSNTRYGEVGISCNNDGTVLTLNSRRANFNSGSFLIYTGNSNIGWTLTQKILSPVNGSTIIRSNRDSTVLAVGNSNSSGNVSIYTGNIGSLWSLEQIISGDSLNSEFGKSVVFNNNNQLFIGAPNDENKGSVSIYKQNFNKKWDLNQKIIGNNRFGWDIDTDDSGEILSITSWIESPAVSGSQLIYTNKIIRL